jgi:hypothetical protein
MMRPLVAPVLLVIMAFATAAGNEPAPATVTAAELIQTFQTNAARSDLLYLDHRVAVRGKLLEIRGGPVAPNPQGILALYSLDLAGPDGKTSPYVSFGFTDRHQKQLATLRAGQEVTVEGICAGWSPGEPVGGKYIVFRDSKIVQVGK